MDPIRPIFDDFCAFPHILQLFLAVFEAEKFALVTPQNYLISRGFNNLMLGLAWAWNGCMGMGNRPGMPAWVWGMSLVWLHGDGEWA